MKFGISKSPLKKSLLFKKGMSRIQRVLKRKKDTETQTPFKTHNRFIVVDQGRLLILKNLMDHDGNKVEASRYYPEFQSSQKSKNYQLPNQTKNAKIVRVYKLEYLKSFNLKNYRYLMKMYNYRLEMLAKANNGIYTPQTQVSLDKLTQVCGADISIVSLNWLSLIGLEEALQFRGDTRM